MKQILILVLVLTVVLTAYYSKMFYKTFKRYYHLFDTERYNPKLQTANEFITETFQKRKLEMLKLIGQTMLITAMAISLVYQIISLKSYV
jgi:hypothetical protein